MANIDWKFIGSLEGNRLIGYVPDKDGSKSGVTIASGFDLGARNESDIKNLPKDIQEKLKPYLGLKGDAAVQLANKLRISSKEASIINDFSKREATTTLASKWRNATGQDFYQMSKGKQTVLASVAFQYGDLESQTPNFWRQTTSNDWNSALKNLRNFGDNYNTRRNKEASYLEREIQQEEIIEAGGGALKRIKEDLEASQLAENVPGIVKEVKKKDKTVVEDKSIEEIIEGTAALPPETIKDDMALDDMPVFSLPEYKGNPQKKPKFESDNYYINRMTIADDARKIQTETINTAIKSKESALPEKKIVEELLEKDIALSGPISETIKKNEPILEVAESMTELSKAQLQKLLDPKKLV